MTEVDYRSFTQPRNIAPCQAQVERPSAAVKHEIMSIKVNRWMDELINGCLNYTTNEFINNKW